MDHRGAAGKAEDRLDLAAVAADNALGVVVVVSDEAAADRATDVDAVADALARRDRLDSTRTVSPLAAAADAVVVDTTAMTRDEVVEHVVALARAALGGGGA